MPNLTIGELKRVSLYLAGQLKNAVSITGGTITGTTLTGNTITGSISGNTVRQSATITVNTSTTLTNLTGLVQTVVPGTYAFRVYLVGSTGASGGWKVAFKYTTTVVSSIQATSYAFTAAAAAVASTTTATDQASLIAATTAYTSALIEGTMVVGTGGTIQLQFAQNASDGTNSIILLGSSMTFTRIA